MMGRNWGWDNRTNAQLYEAEVRYEMERRVAVWLATRHLLVDLSPTPSPSQPSDEPPNTSSYDETFPPAA